MNWLGRVFASAVVRKIGYVVGAAIVAVVMAVFK